MQCTHRRRTIRSVAIVLGPIVAACVVACSPWQAGAQRDVVEHGIRFDVLKENADGSKVGNLAADTVIDGYPCRKGFVGFHADWRLDECHLATAYERNGINTVLFPHDVVVQGYPCRGTRAGGFMTVFYPTGELHWFFSKTPQQVGEFTCADSLFEAIYLHPDGRLRRCKLDAPATVDGVRYKKGTVLRLDPEGRVHR